MADRPDTVSDLREWLGNKPSVEEAQEVLELEQEADNTRSTAVSSIENYIEESNEEESDEGSLPQFRVYGDTPEFDQGDIVRVDPEEYPTYIRDGRLRRY